MAPHNDDDGLRTVGGSEGESPPTTPRLAQRRSRWGRLVWRWVGLPLLTVLVSSLVIFTALALAPGDPLASVAGSRPSAAARAALERQYGLDRPLIVQYLNWLGGLGRGDLGESIAYRAPVWSLIEPRLGTSFFLISYSTVLVAAVGLTVAILGTVWQRIAPLLTLVSSLAVAVPAYVAASALTTVFTLKLGWFPALGAGTGFWDRLWHLTLPSIALAMGWGAYLSQIVRAALRQEARADHVETGIARGLPTMLVFRRHVLRNAAVPIVTTAALVVTGLLVGSVVVEVAFGIDGIGAFFVRSVQTGDRASVSAISALLVLVIVTMTTILDIVHTLLDPRLRDGGATR